MTLAALQPVNQHAEPSGLCGLGDDFAALGPDLLVPFSVRRLSRPSLLWLNERWFLDAGVDVFNLGVRSEAERWLLRDFAVAVPEETDPADAFTFDTATLFADRYGMPSGGWHGGSGRCGTFGCFNAKGVGRTSLASAEADENHKNGAMLLYEAIMEAVSAEVAAAEMPYGAVPVIAIIDTGYSLQKGAQLDRRAILVRPNSVRPAHFERSFFFGDAGSINSHQYRDAARVRSALSFLASMAAGRGVTASELLRQVFALYARQLGAAHAHRFWLGAFAAANRALSGELVDFGAFRAVPNWRRFVTTRPECFGDESTSFAPAQGSIWFYAGKYLGDEFGPEPFLDRSEVEAQMEVGFREACKSALALNLEDEWSSNLVESLWHYFKEQQQEEVDAADRSAWRKSWLLDILAPGWRRDPAADTSEHAQEFREKFRTVQSVPDRLATWHSLLRWLLPRPALYQQTSLARYKSFVRRLPGESAVDASLVASFIDRSISLSRRTWTGLPKSFQIRAQQVRGASAALHGQDLQSGRRESWVLGRECGNGFRAFGVEIRPGSAPFEARSGAGAIWTRIEQNDPAEELKQLFFAMDTSEAHPYCYPAPI